MNENRRQELIAGRDVLNLALEGEVVVDIGQLEPEEIAALNKAVRAGELAKWRGKWFPMTGAHYGLGPDKTCWGLPEIANHFDAMRAGKIAYVESPLPVET